MKEKLLTILGTIGCIISGFFGGMDAAMQILIIFMALDYITGLVVAGIFHNSPKTDNGALESHAGLKGLIRKGMMLVIVYVAMKIDIVTGANYIRDAVCIAFVTNELISIIENAGLMGVPIPAVVTNAIEVLKAKSEADQERGEELHD